MATYALTVSPPYRTQSPTYLYNSDKPWLQKQLNRCSDHYIMYPEFDERGRLHYHGIILLRSISSWGFVKSTIDKNLGFCCLKKLGSFRDKLGWLLYCTKEHQEAMPGPIMYHTFPKGRPKRSMDTGDVRTIIDYLDEGKRRDGPSGLED